MGHRWKDKESEKGPADKVKDSDKSKDKEGTKEAAKDGKEITGKELGKDKDVSKEAIKDGKERIGKEGTKDRELTGGLPADLDPRVAEPEEGGGVGAPFIGPEERPEVGEAAVDQPLDEDDEDEG